MVVARATTTRTRLTPYQRGAIYALFVAGYTYSEISEEIVKGDLEEINGLFLDAKASAKLLQEQADKYIQ